MATKRDENFKKRCKKCNKIMNLTFFYGNRGWSSELYRDAWCKSCANKHVSDLDTMAEYCNANRREFKIDLWDWAVNKSKEECDKLESYGKTTDLIKKNEIFMNIVCKRYFQHMNRVNYYSFDGKSEPVNVSSDGEVSIFDGRGENKEYSSFWKGYFTKGELKSLNEHYEGLYKDFKLENTAYIDYAKKVCKASLAMDKAFADMCDGVIGAEKRYKDFKDIFDQLSQSAKFAEKTRSENDAVGFGSLGEIIKRMETTGFLQTKVEFEKDDIDLVMEDYKWILTSTGGEE